MSFDFDTDAIMRNILDQAREQTEENILNAASELQREMGTDGDGISAKFEPASGGRGIDDTEALGSLTVTGPSQEAAERFKDRLLAKIRQ